MNLKTIAITSVALLVLPALAFAQTGLGVSANANINADGVNAGASGSVSATAMTTAKERANKEIDRRITALTALNSRVGDMNRVSAQFKSQLDANIQSQISSLTTLKGTIDSDGSTTSLKTDVKSITDSYRIYMLVLPQSRIAAAADRAVNIATMESALGAKLKVRIDTAAATGADVTALNDALNDIASTTAAAVAEAQAAVAVSAALQPDQGDKTVMASNEAALKTAKGDIQTTQQYLVQARKDITTILKGLKALGASASASTSAQTQ